MLTGLLCRLTSYTGVRWCGGGDEVQSPRGEVYLANDFTLKVNVKFITNVPPLLDFFGKIVSVDVKLMLILLFRPYLMRAHVQYPVEIQLSALAHVTSSTSQPLSGVDFQSFQTRGRFKPTISIGKLFIREYPSDEIVKTALLGVSSWLTSPTKLKIRAFPPPPWHGFERQESYHWIIWNPSLLNGFSHLASESSDTCC